MPTVERRGGAPVLCGPVLHARPDPLATREPLQFSAPRSTATPGSRPTWKCRTWRSTACRAGVGALVLDMGDAASCQHPGRGGQGARVARRDRRRAHAEGSQRVEAPARLSAATREALLTLLDLYGGIEGWRGAPSPAAAPAIAAALDDLPGGHHLRTAHPAIEVASTCPT